MRIPEIREELLSMASRLSGVNCDLGDYPERLRKLSEELKRRPARKGAPGRTAHDPMTDDKRETIRKLAGMYPHMTGAEIARRVNVSPARVSETLNGKRQ